MSSHLRPPALTTVIVINTEQMLAAVPLAARSFLSCFAFAETHFFMNLEFLVVGTNQL